VLAVLLSGAAGFPANELSNFAAMALAYLQAQFLAAWIVLGSGNSAIRYCGGLQAMIAVVAPPLVYGALDTGLIRFPLKIVAGTILLPAAVVVVGLMPEICGPRRIRWVYSSAWSPGAPPQFTLRALFIATVLSAALVFAARFFPLQISTASETPWMGQLQPGTAVVFLNQSQVSFGAFILAPPAAVVVATCILLMPGRVWWLAPAPIATGFLTGVAVSAMEERSVTTQSLWGGVVCAVISLIVVAHFLMLRACGYRLIDESEAPVADC
jgi:hypothetical protein